MTIERTSKKGLIIISILSAVDYHVIMWWLCDNHPMIIIDQLLICYLQTNIQTYLNMMIMWSSWDWHKIIMSHSDLLMVIWIQLMIIWLSSDNHLMIIWLSSEDHLKNKRGLIIMRIVSAFDYHMIMWWSFNDHNWPIADLFLIKSKQTNK